MEITKIPQERIGDYVLFPRSQYPGLNSNDCPKDLDRDEYVLKSVDVEGDSKHYLLEQVASPGRTMQLFLPVDEHQFDDYLSKLLAMSETPIYIVGRTDFLVLFIGSREKVQITQESYKEVDRQILEARDRAAYWWMKYGEIK